VPCLRSPNYNCACVCTTLTGSCHASCLQRSSNQVSVPPSAITLSFPRLTSASMKITISPLQRGATPFVVRPGLIFRSIPSNLSFVRSRLNHLRPSVTSSRRSMPTRAFPSKARTSSAQVSHSPILSKLAVVLNKPTIMKENRCKMTNPSHHITSRTRTL
jgi:hypothetical protein